eukprot:UN08460
MVRDHKIDVTKNFTSAPPIDCFQTSKVRKGQEAFSVA